MTLLSRVIDDQSFSAVTYSLKGTCIVFGYAEGEGTEEGGGLALRANLYGVRFQTARPISLFPLHLTVTFVYCVQAAEYIVKLLSQPSSPIILAFDAKYVLGTRGSPPSGP